METVIINSIEIPTGVGERGVDIAAFKATPPFDPATRVKVARAIPWRAGADKGGPLPPGGERGERHGLRLFFAIHEVLPPDGTITVREIIEIGERLNYTAYQTQGHLRWAFNVRRVGSDERFLTIVSPSNVVQFTAQTNSVAAGPSPETDR